MAEWRERVLGRLRGATDAYDRGDVELPLLQTEVDAAAAALESPDADLIAALRQAEAELDSIRFTVATEDQQNASADLLVRLRGRMQHVAGC